MSDFDVKPKKIMYIRSQDHGRQLRNHRKELTGYKEVVIKGAIPAIKILNLIED
jgi:hypothetical protein